jgi:hypothetical protein
VTLHGKCCSLHDIKLLLTDVSNSVRLRVDITFVNWTTLHTLIGHRSNCLYPFTGSGAIFVRRRTSHPSLKGVRLSAFCTDSYSPKFVVKFGRFAQRQIIPINAVDLFLINRDVIINGVDECRSEIVQH